MPSPWNVVPSVRRNHSYTIIRCMQGPLKTILLTTVVTNATSVSLTVFTLKSTARTFGDFCLSQPSSAAGPSKTVRRAYKTFQNQPNTTSEQTSLEDTFAPKIPLHWARIAWCVKKCVVLPQHIDFRTILPIVDGCDVGYRKYTDGVCTKC